MTSVFGMYAKKERGKIPLSFFLCFALLSHGLGLVEIMAVVGQAGLAHPVGQTERSALGAGGDAGGLQLPHAAAALVPALLGHFTLRDCHL